MQIKLKAFRINAGLSLKEMAEKLNVCKSTISKWERDELKIPLESFDAYCRECHVDEPTKLELKNFVRIR